jgi:hypothetical protein
MPPRGLCCSGIECFAGTTAIVCSGGLLQQELPMAHLPVLQNSPRSTKSAARAEQTGTIGSRLLATMSDRDLIALVIFCGIGILLTVNVILRFPDFGIRLQELAQFLG